MSKPNIILINCDDLGYGDLGCYGSSMHHTPYADHLAANGILCTDFYAASPVCSPSRGALLTGCYPPRIGFGQFEGICVLTPGQGLGLSTKERSIASLLKQAGYRTGLVGKWHCGDQPDFLPLRHGFDFYYGLPYSNDMGRQQGDSPQAVPLPLLQNETVIQQQPDQALLTQMYVEQCRSFIHANRSAPFFLYFAHMHPHVPLYAPETFLLNSHNGAYGACVEEIDWALGELLHELQSLGLEKDTLIVFTSDNGSRCDHGPSNGKLRGTKGTTWEGGQRVPCLLYWPGHILPGRYNGVFSNLDFYSSFAHLAGIPLPTDRRIDSLDLSGLLNGDASVPGRDTFFYYWQNGLEAVRQKEWKLHCAKNGVPFHALYNLVSDPAETTDLFSKHPDLVAHLSALLEKCRLDLGDSVTGTVGCGTRPVGRVSSPQPLARYDASHPYVIACYDSDDRG